MAGKAVQIIAGNRPDMKNKIGAIGWGRAAGWVARLILVLFIALEVHIWLDILVFQPQEYQRLIGSESACGVAKSYCSWPAFLLDNIPFAALSILSVIALLWRGMPRREWFLRALAAVICGFLVWRVYDTLPRDPRGETATEMASPITG